MPNSHFLPLISPIIFLTSLLSGAGYSHADPNLSWLQDQGVPINPSDPIVKTSSGTAGKPKQAQPQARSSQELSTEINPSDWSQRSGSDQIQWPAPMSAKITGLPAWVSAADEPKVNALTLTNKAKPAPTQLASNSKQVKPAKKRVSSKTSSVPFSEVIIKLKPVEAQELSPEMVARKVNLETCLKNHYVKPVNADVLRPWSILHGVLAYGQNSLVVSRGQRIKAVDYLCHNGIGNDRQLLLTHGERLGVGVGVGFQGHEGQLLAILAQVQTPLDQELHVNGKVFTVRDLVEYEQATCRPGTELTFKLIGFSVYLKSDAVWKDNTGQGWDISRLMYEEMAQPIQGAACGGTHRLMGLSYALAMRKASNEPIDGQWQRAEKFLAQYHQQALALQTSDGGFSTEFFEGLSASADPIRQLYSTGHILEWFAISMSDEQLVSPPVTKMVDRLLALLSAEFRPEQDLHGSDVGPKGHALRALRLYELRVFGKASNHTQFQDQDPRPILSASEIATLQQGQRTIQPAAVEPSQMLKAAHSGSQPGSPSTSMPSIRGNLFMRRR